MRVAVGVLARLVVYVCFALIIGDAVFELWRDGNPVLAIAAVIFFPVTLFAWPLTHLTDTVFGLPLWTVFVSALIAYPISTFVGGLSPITGVPDQYD